MSAAQIRHDAARENVQNLVMESAVRIVRQIQISMLVSLASYVVVGEMVSRAIHRIPSNPLFHAFSLVSISLVGLTVVVRRTMIVPSEAVLRETPSDNSALSRWRAGFIVSYALCEALGLFGLVLRFTGFTLGNVWGFYLGSFVLLLLYSPGVPRQEPGMPRQQADE